MYLMEASLVVGILYCLSTYTEAVLTENREVSGFTGVESAGPFLVSIDLKGSEGLRIDAELEDTNVTKSILTFVENQSLKIRFDWPYNVDDGRFANLIHISVSAKTINSIILAGSGAIRVNSLLTSPSVSVVSSGSGNVSLSVQTGDLSVVLSGTGNVVANGTAQHLNGVISGAGGLAGNNLGSDSVSVSVYGSGSALVNAKNMLSVVIMGSGQVRYRGSPMLNVMNMGSGSVSRIA